DRIRTPRTQRRQEKAWENYRTDRERNERTLKEKAGEAWYSPRPTLDAGNQLIEPRSARRALLESTGQIAPPGTSASDCSDEPHC
nr:hypothetical protein [Acidimicrobiia bacterium]